MIHAYQLNGYNIIIDVYSGSVHVVDEVAYDVITGYENTERQELIRTVAEKHGVAPDEVEACLADVEAL